MNSTSTKPRCSKCNSVHLEEYNPIEAVEKAAIPEETSIDDVLPVNKKRFSELMNGRILDHFDKMSSIQLLNAMSQGIVTKSPKVQEQENKMVEGIIDSLKQSNETLVDSLSEKQGEEQQAQLAQLEQKPDELSQIVEFAKNNPDIVKQFFKSTNDSPKD